MVMVIPCKPRVENQKDGKIKLIVAAEKNILIFKVWNHTHIPSNLPLGLKIVGIEDGLPVFPVSNIALHKTEIIDCFAGHIIKSFREKTEVQRLYIRTIDILSQNRIEIIKTIHWTSNASGSNLLLSLSK